MPPREPAIAPPTRSAIEVLAPAALIDQGCLACLERALSAALQQSARPEAFEAAALLALRAKELGLPHDEWLEQARDIAGGDGLWTLLLEMVAAVPPDPLGGSREVVLSQTPGRLRDGRLLPLWIEILKSSPGEAAQTSYDTALALVPDHPDALLGRTISLSHLNQHEAAIAAATRLIDGGRWFLGQHVRRSRRCRRDRETPRTKRARSPVTSG